MTSPEDFSSLGLRAELLSALDTIGYHNMTAVQRVTLPIMLKGNDVVAKAKTGSGKTAAFGLSILNKLNVEIFQSQALVLCPSRELAEQVTKELRRLACSTANIKILTLCGGSALGPQFASLQHEPHIVVGTPGRVHKHLRETSLQLQRLHTLVLDEADRMLDMGFRDEIDAILQYVPAIRQTLLFSATYPPDIEAISTDIQRNPQLISVLNTDTPAQITQYWCTTSRENRHTDLRRALQAWGGQSNLVFCNTRNDCTEIHNYLNSQNIAAVVMHGDLHQSERIEALVRFSNRSASVMVATDVAARGIDIENLDVVFNAELPKQAEVYIHRIGRTGRAGKSGTAISLVDRNEEWRWQAIDELQPDACPQKQSLPDPRQAHNRLHAEMIAIRLDGGRRNKLRPGDILGALTASGAIAGDQVGAIDVLDKVSYVAVKKRFAKQAAIQLNNRPIKKKRYRARLCQ